MSDNLLGNKEALFDSGTPARDDRGDEHTLLPREAVAAFFGVNIQVVDHWEKKGIIKNFYTNPSNRRRKRHLFSSNEFFDIDRNLKFVPPTWGSMLEYAIGDGEKAERLYAFLKNLQEE